MLRRLDQFSLTGQRGPVFLEGELKPLYKTAFDWLGLAKFCRTWNHYNKVFHFTSRHGKLYGKGWFEPSYDPNLLMAISFPGRVEDFVLPENLSRENCDMATNESPLTKPFLWKVFDEKRSGENYHHLKSSKIKIP